MNLSKYKYFFVNGCSYTQGGGLEELELRYDSCKPIYEKLYNVTWKTRADVNWGQRLSEILNIPCINYAKCGASTQYVVRTTYDFIFKNWNEKDDFFIIIEKPSPDRFEVYDNDTNEYYIINSDYDRTKEFSTIYQGATREYFNPKYRSDTEVQNKFKNFFNNHCEVKENLHSNEKAIIGLYSFCKLHNIKIFLMDEIYFPSIPINVINNEDYIKIDNETKHILNYSEKHKMTITDDCNSEGYSDHHPGFFAHIKYAQQLAIFLGWKGELNVKIKNYK